ncbi:MAG TPA: Uma2 family endonuclease [Vicinamibacteria bacterium]|nr:Uma2 family endonuclease [Vicinamibacteria bacterium]
MSTLLAPPAEQRMRLSGISWETYERLLAEHEGRQSPRFTYDRGELEIMVISFEHEESNRILDHLFATIAEERGIDFIDAGSTTLKREDLDRGFEPDTCIYIRNAGSIRGKRRIELPADPPPDLVIEVDITSPSIDKMEIYMAMGVPEVWRYDATSLRFFALEGGKYVARAESAVLPGLTSEVASRFLEDARSEPRTIWSRKVREWAKAHPA